MTPVRFVVTAGGRTLVVEVAEVESRYRVRLGDEWVEVDARRLPSGPWSLLIAGSSHLADVGEEHGEVVVALAGETYRVRVEEPGRGGRRVAAARAPGRGQRLVAPMPGRVVAVHVRPGERVSAGAPLLVLEAMKMENEFRATTGGVVTEVRVAPGQAVNPGDLLVVVSPEAS